MGVDAWLAIECVCRRIMGSYFLVENMPGESMDTRQQVDKAGTIGGIMMCCQWLREELACAGTALVHSLADTC